jgi:acetolactate synthase-1/3 small subunit
MIVASALNTLQALNRVVSLLRGRDFQVESLAVARSERSDVARLTIVIDTTRTRPERVTACLDKLEEVWGARCVERSDLIRRETALVKCMEDVVLEDTITLGAVAARLIERRDGTAVLEIAGAPEEVDDAIGSLPPASILEITRLGQLVMARGRQQTTVVTLPR